MTNATSALQVRIKKKHDMGDDEWVVEPLSQITQTAICDYLASKGQNNSQREIFYDGKQKIVFDMSYKDVCYLRDNEHQVPYKFEAYHRKNKNFSWVAWLKGKKGTTQKLKKLLCGNVHLQKK